jgi:NDP-sugar pyrophosphorylase family protein
MIKPTLLVLAAGMGSRYGGMKQLDGVGPNGELILDYSVFDAIRAGFDRVVFVIRKDFEVGFRERFGRKFESRIDVEYAFQDINDLPAGFTSPEGRTKPWGTGQAIYAARDIVKAPFAAINADDFYGAEAFSTLAGFFSLPRNSSEFAIVAYKLRNTLSLHGTVSRGVCELDSDDFLTNVTECTSIRPSATGASQTLPDGNERTFSGDELVSMNFWGFTPLLFPYLEELFADFLKEKGGDAKSEFYIPSAVTNLIERQLVNVKALSTDSSWFGVTYREDRPEVVDTLAKLTTAGVYPSPL